MARFRTRRSKLCMLKTVSFKLCVVFALFCLTVIIHSLFFSHLRQVTAEEKLCGCRRKATFYNLLGIVNQVKWCSEGTWTRGRAQKVVAYSLYGDSTQDDVRKRYFSLLPRLAKQIAHYYPGWVMRVYHKFNSSDISSTSQLCRIYCEFPHIDLCNVTDISQSLTKSPGSIGFHYVNGLNPSLWRFLPLFDSQVALFASRDTDSEIIDREVAAVCQWIDSEYIFHVMRDHPEHVYDIQAGLWGVKLSEYRNEVFRAARLMVLNAQDREYDTDQQLLTEFMWPLAKHNVMAHDSYRCNSKDYLASSPIAMFPFPTRRNERNDFVGNAVTLSDFFRSRIKECPVECRPKDHQDWNYC